MKIQFSDLSGWLKFAVVGQIVSFFITIFFIAILILGVLMGLASY